MLRSDVDKGIKEVKTIEKTNIKRRKTSQVLTPR